MEKHEKELFDFLNASGKIGKLRKQLITLLLCVEDIHEDMRVNGEDGEEILSLVRKIDLLLSEFATSQQLADRMITGLKPQERKAFIEEVPEMLDIFGWQDKFDDDGNIRIED